MIGGQSMFFRMPEMYLDISDNLSSFILSFQDELKMFLKEYQVEYNEEFI